MILVNDIIDGLVPQLTEHADLANKNITFTHSECVNDNVNNVPWVGIYTTKVRHDPHTLAVIHRRWKATASLVIVVQQGSLKSGADCARRLELLIRDVLNAILHDTSFGAAIDMVNELEVTYSFERTDAPSLHFQSGYITLEVELEHEEPDS